MRNIKEAIQLTALYENGKFNRPAIAHAAWRAIADHYGPKGGNYRTQEEAANRAAVLSYGFTKAWEKAHAEKAQADQNAAIPADEKAKRIASMEREIAGLIYLPLGMNAATRRAKLQTQIKQLAA